MIDREHDLSITKCEWRVQSPQKWLLKIPQFL